MEIRRIDPPCWFACMNNRYLQLIVYGADLKDAKVEIKYDIVLAYEIVNMTDSYIILYVDVSGVKHNTKFVLSLSKNGRTVEENYSFFPRRNKRIESFSMKDSIYLLMPDRFSVEAASSKRLKTDTTNPDCWHGGTIKGMTKHINDIADMGFTAIWHTPVFENAQKESSDIRYYDYHGYAATDFYKIDPHFGTIADYCNFVDISHQKGLKVIMDIVFNHCGINHPFVSDPPIKEWFNLLGSHKDLLTNYSPLTDYDRYASEYDKQHFLKGWFTNSMPDINLEKDEVLTYMTQMSIWWIETTDVDAFRVDTYPYAGVKNMEKWQKRLYTEYPGFPLLAEAWVGETEYVSQMQKDNLAAIPDSTMTFMDFAFQRRMSEAIGEKNARMIYTHFAMDFAYETPQNLLAFIDNHDIVRWLHKHPSISELRQAIGILLTIPRIPQVYYGTEILLAGDGKGTSDGNMRQDYPWNLPLNTQQLEIQNYLTKLLRWRKGCRCIAEGEMLHFVPLDDNVYVYFRYLKDKKCNVDLTVPIVMVMVNFSEKKEIVDMARFKDILVGRVTAIDVVEAKDYSPNLLSSIEIDAHGIIILILN